MNKNIISYASALVVAVLIAGLILAGQASPKKTDTSEKASVETQWEYLVVAGGSQNLSSPGIGEKMNKQEGSSFNREAVALERNLDKLGARGWELVSVAGEPRDPVFYLKRAKANH
jgi:hypothetical protein